MPGLMCFSTRPGYQDILSMESLVEFLLKEALTTGGADHALRRAQKAKLVPKLTRKVSGVASGCPLR